MTNGQQQKGRHSDGFRMKLLLWARFWAWRKVRPSEMKGPTQFYPTHNVRFIGETVHRKGSLNFNKTNTKCSVWMRGAVLFFTRNTNIHRILLFIYLYYTISNRHGKPPLGTAGIVVICLRLFECYSLRGIRKEWFTPYIVGTYVFPLTTLLRKFFLFLTYIWFPCKYLLVEQ